MSEITKKVELVIMRGLPGSGKSTWAMGKLKERNWKRVSKDDLRRMIDNGKYSEVRERTIIIAERSLVDVLLKAGCNVIVDDTNLDMAHVNYFNEKYGADPNVSITIQDFTDVPPEVCIERDALRPCPVGSKAIHYLWSRYLRKPQALRFDPNLPTVCICDIDGTICDSIGRKIHEFDKIAADLKTPHSYLIESVPFEIIFVSGREDSSREQTEKWIRDNFPTVKWTHLYMRATGDRRDDAEIKREIWNDHISGKCNVAGVFEDRPVVIRMWRSLGLPVFSVGPLYEF